MKVKSTIILAAILVVFAASGLLAQRGPANPGERIIDAGRERVRGVAAVEFLKPFHDPFRFFNNGLPGFVGGATGQAFAFENADQLGFLDRSHRAHLDRLKADLPETF